jgi:hypothetical protein
MPSPFTLDPNLLGALDDIPLLARNVVEGFLSGLHQSPFLGYSTEFASYRQYMQGDDLRHVDWKVWGRTDKLHVKQFESDTNLNGVTSCWTRAPRWTSVRPINSSMAARWPRRWRI